jgi:hypothetical protein
LKIGGVDDGLFDERRIFAVLAVLFFLYVLLALAAFVVQGTPVKLHLRRWWGRVRARRDRN